MNDAVSKRHMAENEMIFREYNERIQKDFDAVRKIAEEDGQAAHFQIEDAPLHFYCECSDENCKKRVVMKQSLYNKIHTHRDRFVIVPGHDVMAVERIVERHGSYHIVEKTVLPHVAGPTLKPTPVNNV